MKRRDIMEIVVKLFGVLGLVYGSSSVLILLHQLVFMAGEAHSGFADSRAIFLVIGLRCIGYLSSGSLMVLCGSRIARWIDQLGKRKEETVAQGPEENWTVVSRKGFRFCLQLLGVYVLLGAIPNIAECLYQLYLCIKVMPDSVNLWRQVPWLQLALKLAIGIYLLRGGELIVRIAWREKVFPNPFPNPAEPEPKTSLPPRH